MKRRVLIKTAIDGYRVTTPEGEVTGGAVVRELSRDPACIPVFQVLRLVTTWAMERPQRRAGLLPHDRLERLLARIAGKLPFRADDPRGALACILGEMTAGEPDIRRAAFACLGVADWALSHGAVDTALAWARAAALVKPDARYAWIAGRMHREHGRLEEAEVWFKVAYSIAGRTRDWEVRAGALLSCGHTFMVAGNYQGARELFERGLGTARRRRVIAKIAEAHHYLFSIAVTTSDHALVASQSRAILKSYGTDHPRLPHFAHDLAGYWMDRGDFVKAHQVLIALLERFFANEPAARMQVVGSALRAAGAIGEKRCFDRLRLELERLRAMVSSSPAVAPAFLTAAKGAASLSRWTDAEGLLIVALDSARTTHQRDTEVEAETLLESVKARASHEVPSESAAEYSDVARDTLLMLAGSPVP